MQLNFSLAKIEFLKVLIAAVSLLSFILISRFLGSDFLVLFAYLQALIVIVSALYDQGFNVTNLNVNISGNNFTCYKLPLLQTFLSVVFLSIFVIYIYYSNTIQMTYHLLISIAIATPFNVFLMRWNTVLKREGILHTQIIYGELAPAIFRLASIFIGFLGDLIIFMYFVSLTPIFAFFICSKKVSVSNLFIFKKSYSSERSKQNLEDYFLSVFAALKNQMFGLVIPLLPSYLQPSFVVISRVYGLTLIALSGIFARIPFAISLYKKGSTIKKITTLYLLVCFVALGVVLTSVIWLPIIGNIFDVKIDATFTVVFLLSLVILGIFISLNSLIFQVLAKVRLALVVEVLYMIFFILGVKYVQSSA